jgi:hypothetical protein
MPRLLSSVSLVVVLAVTISGAAVRAQQAAPPAGPAAIRPTENLIVEGIPEIPAGLADEVRRYTEARSAAFVGWHPTRVEMLIGTRFGNTAQIHEVRMPGGARRQLTFFAEPIGAADWDPKEGKFFLFTRDTGGNEFGQMYRLDVASGDVTLLSDGSRSQNGGWVWDRAGDRIAYTSTRRNGADRDIWVVDPRDPATDRLVVENAGGGWSVLDWSPDGTQLLVGESLSVNKSRRWLVDVASGAKTRLDDDGPEDVAWGGGTFTPDGGAIWTTTDKDSEFARLVRWTPASGGIEVMAADIPWEVEAFDVSEDGKSVCFITNEAGVSRARVLDTATGKHRLVAGLPDGVIAAGEWHADGRHLAFSVGSARSTSDVYVWDAVEGGPAIRWTESELGGLVADTLVEPRAIDWQSFDGLEIRGFLYPAGDHQHPRGPRGAVTADLSGAQQLLHERARRGSCFSERPRVDRLREDVCEARQRAEARGFGPRHRGPPRLDRHPARSRSRPRHDHRRQLRRLHDARLRHDL